MENLLQRTELMLGPENLSKLRGARVLVFGVGGVGSWCCEALVRTGIGRLTLVDSDCVAETNCNRQLMATSRTVGRPKVEVLRERLLEINPSAQIEALQMQYSAETAADFRMEEYDCIIDAIDSLKDKADLILRATALPRNIAFFSSMGAALKRDPFKVRQAEFWQVTGDPLARALRKKFNKSEVFPARKFKCVYSEELPSPNLGQTDETCSYKAQINGSLCHVTAIFGMALAGMVINHILDR